MKYRLYIPRWFYPYNLGDSIATYNIPKLIKHVFPSVELEVITYGELIEFMEENPYVDLVRNPDKNNLFDCFSQNEFKKLAFEGGFLIDKIGVLYAEFHPKLWSTWYSKREVYENHPTLNLITLNYALQLGLEDYVDSFDFYTPLDVKGVKDKNLLGIVPAMKMGPCGPHAGCDGVGYRFNGDDGDSWKIFLDTINKESNTIKIREFSELDTGFGIDDRVSKSSWRVLLEKAKECNVIVCSEGGLHNLFSLIPTANIYLLGSTRIAKPYFYSTKVDFYDKQVHLECHNRCYNFNIENGFQDLLGICNRSCEKVNPISVAKNVLLEMYK